MRRKKTSDQKAQKIAGDAIVLLQTGDAPKARKKAELGLAKYKDHPALLQALGLAAMSSGDAQVTVDALRKCLKAEPLQSGLWEILGGALEILERFEEALSAYDQAISYDSNRGAAYRCKGVLLVRLQKFVEADDVLNKALELDDTDPTTWFWLGAKHNFALELDDAEHCFSKATELKPDWGQAWVNLASVLANLGRHRRALMYYEKGLELSPDDVNGLRLFAQTLIELQHEDEAERMLKKAIGLSPNDSKTWANLATLYERLNRKEDASKAIANALKEDPENSLALKVSATLEQATGDREKALTLMTQLAQKATTWGQKESIYFELAQLHDKLGNIDDAYGTFTTANQLHRDAAASRHIDPQTFLSHVTREEEILKTSPPEHHAVEPPVNPPDPVFLMGFPRSGTTLLDQVLDSHPGAAVIVLRFSFWTAGLFIVAGVIFALSERQFLTRYFTRAEDPLVMPVAWFTPKDLVKGDHRDNIELATGAEKTIPDSVLKEIDAYAVEQNSQGLIVVHNGLIQLESYWEGANRDTLFNPQSMSKTVLAMLMGIAVDEGHIESLDDPIGKYIKEWSDRPQGTATIRHALWMAAGLEQMSGSYEIELFSRGVWYNFGDDFEGMILDLKQVDPPGTKFEYNNEENNVLGMVIERATGQRYADYLSEKLWYPLGLADASMYLDREGGSVMKSCCIFSRPYDWAKLGQLVLDRGRYNDQQIVPASWIGAMIEPSPLVDHYGYQVWLGSGYIQPGDQGSGDEGADEEIAPDTYATDDMIIFLGYGGQKVWVSPSHNLVIVRATMKCADSWVETLIPNAIINALNSQSVGTITD